MIWGITCVIISVLKIVNYCHFLGGGFGTMSHLKADMGARQKSKMSMVWAASEQKLVLLEESEEKNALAPLTITKAQT